MASLKHKKLTTRTSPSNALPYEPKDWQCIALLVVLVVVFFRNILLGTAWLWEDMLYYSYPVRSFAATSMAMGQMPLWNPYTFNGMPFLADIQTAVFYLPLTALALFVHHGALSFYWLEVAVIFHYVIAGSAMYALGRSFGLRQIPSLFAGVAYMLSGFMITHAIHQQIITLVAWYPLVWLFFIKALTRRQWRWVFLAAVTLGHSTLAGYPQLTLYLYCFLFVAFIFELTTTYRGRALLSRPAVLMTLKAGCIVALSVAIAMIQLLPTLELADLSQRAQITYEKSTEGSLAWSQLLTLLYPKFFGAAGATGYSYWGPGPYWHYWETCIYLGVSTLLLMILSARLIRKNKYVALLWGVALFAVLFAFGNNFILHKVFFDFVPGFSRFRNPARIGILLSLAASLLAAFSLHHLLYQTPDARARLRLRNTVLAAFGAGVLIGVLIISGALSGEFAHLQDEQSFAWVQKEALLSLFILAVSGALIVGLIMSRKLSRYLGPAVVAVLFLDLAAFGNKQHDAHLNPDDYFGRAKALVQFLKQQGESEIFRVNTRNSDGMIMDRNQGMVDRIFTMEGYTPLVLQRAYAPYATNQQTYDLLNVKYRTVTDRQAGRLSLEQTPAYLPRAFFLYQVQVAHNQDELLTYVKMPTFDDRTVAILEKDPGVPLTPPATPPVSAAHITAYENNRIALRVETSHDGLLVLSEIFYPGWKAYVDGVGTEVFRADYNLRSILVSRGEHTVEFLFEPEPYVRGKWITLGAILVCLAGIIVSAMRSARSDHSITAGTA